MLSPAPVAPPLYSVNKPPSVSSAPYGPPTSSPPTVASVTSGPKLEQFALKPSRLSAATATTPWQLAGRVTAPWLLPAATTTITPCDRNSSMAS
jgi:hypothetical protein